MLSINAWVLVAGTILGIAAGQILFKMGALRINADSNLGLLAWLNGPVLLALTFYGLSTLLWIGALRALPLRVAYPVSALSYILVPIFGHLLLNEPLSVRTFFGAALIIAGVAVSSRLA